MAPDPGNSRGFRIRTITAGVPLESAAELRVVEAALAFLDRTRASFEAAGYEVQTVRVATQPLAHYLPDWAGPAALGALGGLDRLVAERGVPCSLGPVITGDVHNEVFASWAADLVRRTRNLMFSVSVASPDRGVHRQALRSAAEAILAMAGALPGGEGNFRFAATALAPPGTAFFPAAWFTEGETFSLGLETPALLREAFASAADFEEAKRSLKRRLEAALVEVEQRASAIARDTGWRYLGIDASPAPGPDASIGEAIETLTGTPFGNPSTLTACATITDVLGELSVEKCGYSGLMLPVLEDPVLARRAAEGRYGLSELLLYSSVCGTGLDVVPLPGDVSATTLERVIADVAGLAVKLRKPLSARLLPIPGKKAGEPVRLDDPRLTDGVVMGVG